MLSDHDEYDDPIDPVDPADAEADRRVLGWGRSANPNTADGQLQSVSAFAEAAIAAKGWRRTVARLVAWAALVFIVVYLLLVFGVATKVL